MNFPLDPPTSYPLLFKTRLEEVAPAAIGDMASALAFALARLSEGLDNRPLIFVASRYWLQEQGMPQPAGLAYLGCLLVVTERDEQALWALEEALKSGAISAGVSGVMQAPFVTTRRLGFAAKTGRAAAVLLRGKAQDDLSSAHLRWRIAASPSAAHPFDLKASGAARIRAALTRRRDGPPGTWDLEMDDETHRLRLVAGLADHGLVEGGRTSAAA